MEMCLGKDSNMSSRGWSCHRLSSDGVIWAAALLFTMTIGRASGHGRHVSVAVGCIYQQRCGREQAAYILVCDPVYEC